MSHRTLRDSVPAKAVAVGDIDGDGDPDLVISCENATEELEGLFWIEDPLSETPLYHRLSRTEGIKFDRIALLDLDGDGDLDVMTCEEGYLGVGLGLVIDYIEGSG